MPVTQEASMNPDSPTAVKVSAYRGHIAGKHDDLLVHDYTVYQPSCTVLRTCNYSSVKGVHNWDNSSTEGLRMYHNSSVEGF